MEGVANGSSYNGASRRHSRGLLKIYEMLGHVLIENGTCIPVVNIRLPKRESADSFRLPGEGDSFSFQLDFLEPKAYVSNEFHSVSETYHLTIQNMRNL
jgi:hypothetical protein